MPEASGQGAAGEVAAGAAAGASLVRVQVSRAPAALAEQREEDLVAQHPPGLTIRLRRRRPLRRGEPVHLTERLLERLPGPLMRPGPEQVVPPGRYLTRRRARRMPQPDRAATGNRPRPTGRPELSAR